MVVAFSVVYHLIPTSNHNLCFHADGQSGVVYHLIPTSNHNLHLLQACLAQVVYHLIPTSNHNSPSRDLKFFGLYII